MVGVSITVEGSDLADKALASAVRRLDDPLPFFDAVGGAMVASVAERFRQETDPEGNPWPQSLRVKLEGGKTLTDKGILAGSVTHEASSRSVEIGTNDPRAAIHQFGGVIRAKTAKGLRFRPMGSNSFVIVQSVTMPRRAFLGIDGEDINTINRLAGEFVAEAFGQAGLDGYHAG